MKPDGAPVNEFPTNNSCEPANPVGPVAAMYPRGVVDDKGQITTWLSRDVDFSIEGLNKPRNKMPTVWGVRDLPLKHHDLSWS